MGGGASGTNFSSIVDPGSYLGAGDAATVSGSGGGGAGGNNHGENTDGILAGGQVGCNLQTGTFVFGVEGDLDYFRSNPNFNNNTNTLANGNAFSISQSLTTNYLATVRPRIGIAADRNLAYITGGAAFTSVSYTESYVDANTPLGAGTATASKSPLVGWTAGAGWEYAFADHWTVKAEYLFVSFPTITANGVITGAGGTNALHGSTDLVVQLVRAGVELQVLIARESTMFELHPSSLTFIACRARRRSAASRRENHSGETMSTNNDATISPARGRATRRCLSALIAFVAPILLSFVPLTSFTTTAARACACGCSVFDVGGLDLPQEQDHGGRVFFEFWDGDQTENYVGSSRAPSASIPTKQSTTQWYNVGFSYNFNRDWGVMVRIPEPTAL